MAYLITFGSDGSGSGSRRSEKKLVARMIFEGGSVSFQMARRIPIASSTKPDVTARPPHSPTPVPILTVSGAADAKANSLQ
jgi:hypothetical protein